MNRPGRRETRQGLVATALAGHLGLSRWSIRLNENGAECRWKPSDVQVNSLELREIHTRRDSTSFVARRWEECERLPSLVILLTCVMLIAWW